ncbi:cupredoxin domain-containing protein [Tengunoibacter tsumagoiensis]|uniref:Blue (type 1) copper domain-containing protein n=1 Tax=Tengunoibacter tsumagoiensis TaxID=2014871 RepID=A0A402A0M7_9CHLR|nr:plastocyanin/azurin family copper-binding protein [Tengunoibacter tsumagoiensis]GCE12612.1 hypothetical protein KTT_24710 [Tengunoibacter tsumagoiensis]
MYKKLLFGLLTLALVSVLFSACRVIDTSTIPQNPKAEMGATTFITSTVTIKKGQYLDLVDTVAAPHVIANGTWANGQQQKTKETGAPDVAADFKGNDVTTIGPFNTAGTFNILCTIHPGMNLTITVTP